MNDRFTRVVARVLVIFGCGAIAVGVLSAGIALWTEEWRQGVTGTQAALERAAVVGFLILSGFLAGSPFIVFGLLLRIFLDQRMLLARLLRHVRRRDARTRGAPQLRRGASERPGG
ncbi:MAG: hypothetical protein DMD91_21065 [Candidatus Rokuibacteriota bacterium]|nr:MAG: hypothetical protein DMD91_21065 [Candidatus Rokubacteria bacterium]